VSAYPWPGTVAAYASVEDEGGFETNLLLDRRSLIGRTITPLARARSGMIDRGAPLQLRLTNDPLKSVTERALLAGANVLAIGDGSLDGWEVMQFSKAKLVAPNIWEISNRLRGQAGTDAIMPDIWPKGSLVVLLDSGPQQVDLPPSARGQERFWRIGPALRSPDDASYRSRSTVAQGVGLRPYSPCHLALNGRQITWVRRGRIESDGWDGTDIPLGEENESYLVQLEQDGRVIFETQTDRPSATLSDLAWVQLQSGIATVRVCQMSRIFGRGPFARRDFDVQ
jgi:hypothetical protein